MINLTEIQSNERTASAVAACPEPAAPAVPAYRNIHFAPPAAVASPASSTCSESPTSSAFTGRRRWVTRSPDEEYAARPGEVEPLAAELCALILFRKSRVTCTRDGLEVTIEMDGAEREVKRKYWHENALCCQPCWLGKEVFAVYNRHDPHCVYVFDGDGALIEAVPEKQLADFFSPAAELAAHKRHQEHALKRIEDLHAPDTRAAIARAAANAAQMVKVVHTFPAPAGATTTREEIVSRDSLARDSFAPASSEAAERNPVATYRAAIARGIEQHEEAIATHRQERAAETAAINAIDPASVLARRAAAAQPVPPAETWL